MDNNIDFATRILDQIIHKRDISWPSTFSALTGYESIEKPTLRPVSGTMDHDYPNAIIDQGILTQNNFILDSKAAIPQELIELLNHAESNACHMGLFPEISRAWITIDSDLYLWNYIDGSDLSYYDSLKEIILTAALVPVKPNVFKSSINHLLCVTTPNQIVLLAFLMVDAQLPDQTQKIILEVVSQPIFVISTDGCAFNVILGSRSGRIFLGAGDGSIHEVCYRSGRGWFRDRCWKVDLSSSIFSSIFNIPKFLYGGSNSDSILQIEIDNLRKILFTRRSSGTIEAFDLGTDDTKFSRVGYLDYNSIVREVMHVSKNTLESSNVKKILSIGVLEYGELNMVAVTDSGTRLYFSCYSPILDAFNLAVRPNGLFLVHVRLPPGYCPKSTMKRPSNAHKAFYTQGIFTLSSHVGPDQDGIWLISQFPYPFSIYSEIPTLQLLPGITLDIKSIPPPKDIKINPREYYSHDIYTQHLDWNRSIVILTGNGTAVYRLAKPYELLYNLFVEKSEKEAVVAAHFEMANSKEQPLANCLLLAIHPKIHNPSVTEMATRAFFLYGSLNQDQQRQQMNYQQQQQSQMFQPTTQQQYYQQQQQHHTSPQQQSSYMHQQQHVPSSPMQNINATYDMHAKSPMYQQDNSMVFNPNVVSTPTSDYQYQYVSPNVSSPYSENVAYLGSNKGPILNPAQSPSFLSQQRPRLPPPSSPFMPQASPLNRQPLNQMQQQPNWPYSPKHDALYLVVGRILNSFWNKLLVRQSFIDESESETIIVPNIDGEEVTSAINFLQSILNFIINNPTLYMTRPAIRSYPQTQSPHDGRYNEEKNSISYLKAFLTLGLEVLGMWKILCDHQFHIVLHGIDDRLKNTTMRELIVAGHQTVSIIINALIAKYLGDNAAVDAISIKLRDVCPTLFKNEDAIGSKVAEIFAKVRAKSDKTEKKALLNESLQLCEKICGQESVNVRAFCQQFAELNFPTGAVKLCITAAKSADPEQLAMAALKTNNISMLNPANQNAYQIRNEIYKTIFDVLNEYVTISITSQSPQLRKSPEEVRNVLSSNDAKELADETIKAILSSEDEIFHVCLYNWLLERKLFDRLLEIKHPYLDSFLQRAADAVLTGKYSSDGSNDTRILDLLWRHHEMNGNHEAAAEILSKMADTTTTGIILQQRIEYLSRGIIAAKSCFHRGEILENLEDKLEVAQIQKFIQDSLAHRIDHLTIIAAQNEEAPSPDVKIYQDAISKLNGQLFNITNLYVDFAMPFKIHEAKLEIFHAAGHSDKATIDSLWADIIDDELRHSTRQSLESQMEVIRRKLVLLGRKYIRLQVFFPVEYLIEHLESMKPSENVDPGWVFKTMLEIGVEFNDLLFIYESVWKKAIGQKRGNFDISITNVIIIMIDMYARKELNLRNGYIHRQELIEKSKNLIAAMIVEFTSRFDGQASQIRELLNELKDKLSKTV